MSNRVIGNNVNINGGNIKNFFNERCAKSRFHRYNYANLQDANPELALKRDIQEKEKLARYLKFSPTSRILDIGCGVGRWADEVQTKVSTFRENGCYVGLDFSQGLLDIAKGITRPDDFYFYCGAFQELPQILTDEQMAEPYDYLLINGVLTYINDEEIERCLESIIPLTAAGGRLYLKEGVGVSYRLTLKDFYSDELQSEYSAIYRSLKEYTNLLAKVFALRDWTLLYCGPIWDDDLENRRETSHYYWVWEK